MAAPLWRNESAPPPAAAPGGLAANGSVVTQLLNQVNQLQSQVQQLNGEVDTLQNQVNTQHDATEKEIGDLNFKVSNAGGAPGGGPGAPQNQGNGGNLSNGGPQMAPPPQAPGPNQNAAAAPAPTTPRATLHAAQAAFTRHDYATTESLSRSILSTAKSSPEAYQAQFLLAQALSGEGKPQEAAIAFDDSYNRNRTGAEAPQALLGLADLFERNPPERSRVRHAVLAQQPVPLAASGDAKPYRCRQPPGALLVTPTPTLLPAKTGRMRLH